MPTTQLSSKNDLLKVGKGPYVKVNNEPNKP